MKLLYHGDSPAVATGLGVTSKNILAGLHTHIKDLETTIIGINDFGCWKDPNKYPYKIYPAIYNEPADLWGAARLVNTLIGKDPEIEGPFDVLFVNSDFFLLDQLKIGGRKIKDWIKDYASRAGIKKTILYTPIDNDYLSAEWVDAMNVFDEVVVASSFAKDVVRRYDNELARRTHVLYYPLDVDNFYPKKEVHKPFVIGYVGRNQWRKDIYRVIEIFDKFKKSHQKAFLYIHTNGTDRVQLGWNLFELLKRKGYYMERDYYIPIDHNENRGIKRETMNDVYNKFDVFLSASTGEGFGLPYAEAMLAEVPVLIPDNTVAEEFLGHSNERGYRYKCNIPYSFGWTDMNRIRMLGDIDDAVTQLSHIYKNYSEAREKAKKANAHMRAFTIDYIGQQFSKLLLTNTE